MTGEACNLPAEPEDDEYAIVQRLLGYSRIAIVGLSDDPSRPSFGVASYLISVGKQIIPVNPTHTSVLGLACYPSLESISDKVELVNVFRRPQFCPDIARSAIAIGAKGLWLQSGIISDEARRLAREAGMDYVEDRCLMVDHMRHAR